MVLEQDDVFLHQSGLVHFGSGPREACPPLAAGAESRAHWRQDYSLRIEPVSLEIGPGSGREDGRLQRAGPRTAATVCEKGVPVAIDVTKQHFQRRHRALARVGESGQFPDGGDGRRIIHDFRRAGTFAV